MTIGTEKRQRCFADETLATVAADLLVSVCAHHGATLMIGCVMPDHVHAVVEVTSGNLVAIVRSYKSLVVRCWWESGQSGTLWQRSFHDHGLRSGEDVEAAIAYVFENPARAGIVVEPGLYQHLRGSGLIGGGEPGGPADPR